MADKDKNPAPPKSPANTVALDASSPARAIKGDTAEAPSKPDPSIGQALPGPNAALPSREKSEKAGAVRSVDQGDMPDTVRKRYYSDKAKWSGDAIFFTSPETKDPAFRDQGRRLVTATESQEVVKDLVAIAQHRGWEQIHVTGSEAFRRAAWLEASRQGIEVRGFKPNERDIQELDRVRAAASRNSITPSVKAHREAEPGADRSAASARPSPSARTDMGSPGRPGQDNDRAARSQLRVIEAVIRRTLFDNPEAIGRVMSVAQAQFDAHVAAGRPIRPAQVRQVENRERQAPGDRATAQTSPSRETPGRAPRPPQRSRSR
jgi:hypothetical protein